ncbi:hypothetical protein IF2G_10984 [Cordyceps javanica]|nr:hypothetical protein IF2G_10984 [Cordyceps javanica]
MGTPYKFNLVYLCIRCLFKSGPAAITQLGRCRQDVDTCIESSRQVGPAINGLAAQPEEDTDIGWYAFC